MEVYAINQSGFFIRKKQLGKSDMNPKRSGEYLVPKGCITTPIMPEKQGFMQRWNGVSWEYFEATTEAEKPDFAPEQKGTIKRIYRDRLLRESDWTQLTDAPLSKEKKSEWKEYRKALRDFTDLEGWESLDLPKQPTK